MKIDNDAIAYPAKSLFGPALSNTVSSMAMSNDILFKWVKYFFSLGCVSKKSTKLCFCQ